MPDRPGHSMYVRPYMFSHEGALGVHRSSASTLAVIMSPVGPYFKSGGPWSNGWCPHFHDFRVGMRLLQWGMCQGPLAGSMCAPVQQGRWCCRESNRQPRWHDGLVCHSCRGATVDSQQQQKSLQVRMHMQCCWLCRSKCFCCCCCGCFTCQHCAGSAAVRLFLDTKNVRAWPGGSGEHKIGGNYAPTVMPQMAAMAKHNCSQVCLTASQVTCLFPHASKLAETNSRQTTCQLRQQVKDWLPLRCGIKPALFFVQGSGWCCHHCYILIIACWCE